MLLNKEAILAALDLKFEDVEVPEWGGTVRVSVMRGTDRDSLAEAVQKSSTEEGGALQFQTRLLVRCLTDEQGTPLFTEENLAALNTKSKAVLDRLYEVADRINGTSLKAVDDAEKN